MHGSAALTCTSAVIMHGLVVSTRTSVVIMRDVDAAR
jgi:hypothetical protein